MSSGRRNVLSGFMVFSGEPLSSGPVPRSDSEVGHQALDGEPYQGHRDEHLPAEPHDLVVAVARERCAEPEEEEERDEDLEGEPAEARLREEIVGTQVAVEGRKPSAEEEHG